MRRLVVDLWRDEGAATGLEWALVASVLVLGSVLALVAIRSALL
jgi:hypothetical protein